MMNLSDSSDDEGEHSLPLSRLQYVRSLGRAELQRFVMEPPGEGFAVIYVFVNIKDGKVYVGKHEHGSIGKSFWSSRYQAHRRPLSNNKTYWANAMRLHGEDSFEYYIIWHGPQSEVNHEECFWISPLGLHAIEDLGGCGYNSREGGDGGHMSESSKIKRKETTSSVEFKTAQRDRAVEQARLEEELDPGGRSRRVKEQWHTKESCGEMTITEYRKQWYDNASIEVKLEIGERISAGHKRRRDERIESTANDIEKKQLIKDASRRKSKYERQKQRLAILRAIPGWEKALMSDLAIATKLGIDLSIERTTIKNKHEKKMEGMDDEQKKLFLKEVNRNAVKNKKKSKQVKMLKAIPGWEKASTKDISRAKKAGIDLSVD